MSSASVSHMRDISDDRLARSSRSLPLRSRACCRWQRSAPTPSEEMAKQKSPLGGGIDPAGDSWLSMQHSLEQFLHPEFILRLFLSFMLAVACAWVVAWHPRRSSRLDSLSDLEERKTLVILGMVGAIVAELSGTNQTLAFVIFGIGALLRFPHSAR